MSIQSFHATDIVWWTLVLCTLYRPRVGILALLFGYALAGREFALIYFRFGNIPVFITEPVLAIFLFSHAREAWAIIRKTSAIYKSPWFWLGCIALLDICRGLTMAPPILVLRDAGIVYYSIFALLTYLSIREKRDFRILFWTLVVALGIRIPIGFIWPMWLGGYTADSASGMYSAVLVLATFAYVEDWSGWEKILLAIYMGIQIAVMTGSVVRSIWVAFLGAIVVMSLLDRYLRVNRKAVPRLTGLTFISVSLLCAILKFASPVQLEGLKSEALSFFKGSNSPNVMTRVAMWEDAVQATLPFTGRIFKRFDHNVLNPWLGVPPDKDPLVEWPPQQHAAKATQRVYGNPHKHSAENLLEQSVQEPKEFDHLATTPHLAQDISSYPVFQTLFGTPFGKKFIPFRVSFAHQVERYDPHNSLIAVLFRTGVLGIAAFIAILGSECRRAWRFAISISNREGKKIVFGILLGITYHVFHSLTDVTLENPFKGGLYWMLIGLLLAAQRLYAPSRDLAEDVSTEVDQRAFRSKLREPIGSAN